MQSSHKQFVVFIKAQIVSIHHQYQTSLFQNFDTLSVTESILFILVRVAISKIWKTGQDAWKPRCRRCLCVYFLNRGYLLISVQKLWVHFLNSCFLFSSSLFIILWPFNSTKFSLIRSSKIFVMEASMLFIHLFIHRLSLMSVFLCEWCA